MACSWKKREVIHDEETAVNDCKENNQEAKSLN